MASVASPDDHSGFVHAAGVISVLTSLSVLIVVAYAKRGAVADGLREEWRPSFSPGNLAFSIWSVIFLLSTVSILYQLAAVSAETIQAASWHTNIPLAVSYALCTTWLCVVGDGSSRAPPRVAAGVLVAAAGAAFAACALQETWRKHDLQLQSALLLALPVGLYSGWLLVACTLSVSIAILSAQVVEMTSPLTPVENERRDGNYTILNAANPVDRTSYASWVLPLLGLLVAGLAVALTDPSLPLPVIWGLLFVRGHVKILLTLGMLVVVVACIVVYLIVRVRV